MTDGTGDAGPPHVDRLGLDAVGTHRPREVTGTDRSEWAGVLVPVIERRDGHHLLFTERAADMRTHAGEMSFPGGGYEADDGDLETTALREADEEIGLAPMTADVVGPLDDLPGPYGHVVRPFVARVPDRTYDPDEREVASVALIPVSELTAPGVYENETRSHPDRGTARLPFFRVDDHVVWGLTGFIVRTLLDLTTDWNPPDRGAALGPDPDGEHDAPADWPERE
ncbi:coenzyme A pyrophosphatase [Haloglomus irregulare]|jgi:8-oxo-dGTP pyrophosphatase MutT (NUDIX family)|uniref:Coenzyme A pyrophosphatase n=1 Tax=Haloglomus irregulare TaxID=2234134 RepID=A0A554MXT4_9EURY|nr:CoA pyrophosphatase [Haloglomus irregulare]TSD09947.1 coenzyme A pyrophosphatase [Haloglomus irregulare]